MKRPVRRLGWEIAVTQRDLGHSHHDPRWNSREPSGAVSHPAYRANGVRGPDQPVSRPRHIPWPSTVIWRWRWELGTLAGVVLLGWVSWMTTGVWILVIVPIVVSSLALIRPCHVLLSRRGAAVAVQHRIRIGCSETGLYGPDGELPAVLWTKVVPHGERIYLRMPAAVTVEQFRAVRQRLAGVCRARSVRVARHQTSDQLVVLDIVRRGPDESIAENAAVRRLPRPRQRQEA